jgi:hypothetical protein
MIDDFSGSAQAKDVRAIEDYVKGIDLQCLNMVQIMIEKNKNRH